MGVLAAPSLLNVLAQAGAEQATATHHDVLRILVPIAFCCFRLFGPGNAWVDDSWEELQKLDAAGEDESGSRTYYHWCVFHLGLAIINQVFTAWNLFGFLLLRALPEYFDKEETPRVEMAYVLLPLPKRKEKSG